MEVAQRYSIAWKGLKNGRHDFRFEVDKALFEAFESTEIKDGRCEVSVGVDRSEKQLTLDVGITGHVVVECDRCLEDCRVPIDFEGQLVVKFSDEVHEYDGEVMWMLPGEDRVELAQYIYESIVLSLPYQRVHPEGECNPGVRVDRGCGRRRRGARRGRMGQAGRPARADGGRRRGRRRRRRGTRRREINTDKDTFKLINYI